MIILVGSFLAFFGWLNIWLVVLVALAGIILSDNFWYWLGRRFRNSLGRFLKFLCPNKYQSRFKDFQKNFNKRYPRFIFLSKFVYGFRIIILLLAGKQGVVYRRFFCYNLAANLIWLGTVIFLGAVMGFSWSCLEQYNYYARYFALLFILFFLIVRLIFKRFLVFEGRKVKINFFKRS